MFSIRHADCFQDGADFYEETEDDCPKLASYPKPVRDHDTEAAARARHWFITEWCPAHGIVPRFE